MKRVAEALKQKGVSAGIRSIRLENRHVLGGGLGDAALIHLAGALAQGCCPNLHKLEICDPTLTEPGLNRLADVLATGCCPALATLVIGIIYSDAVHARFVALRAGACSADLIVGIGIIEVSSKNIDTAVAAIESRRCIELQIDNYSWSAEDVARFLNALAVGANPMLLELAISSLANNFADQGITHLASTLAAGRCPNIETLNVVACEVENAGAIQLADALGTGACPRLERLAFSFNEYLGDPAVIRVCQAIENENGPKLLKDIDFTCTDIGDDGLIRLTNTLAMGHCRELELLDLRHTSHKITDTGVGRLADVVEMGCCPELKMVSFDHDPDDGPSTISEAMGVRIKRAVIRGRLVRPRRKFILHARAVGWFVCRYKAAKARVDFAPGGTGALKAKASFEAAAAGDGGGGDDDNDEPPAKRARTQ